MVRVKYRYCLIEIVCEDFLDENIKELPFSTTDVYGAVYNSILEMYGDYGIGVITAGLNVKLLNPYTRIAYVRAKRGPHFLLTTSLPFVTKIKKTRCSFRSLHLAGTIRSCHKYLQRYHHEKLASMLQKCSSDEEKQAVQNSILSCLSQFNTKTYAKTETT